jgi:hypothetical protein
MEIPRLIHEWHGSKQGEETAPLTILILYRNVTAAGKAAALVSRLAERFGSEFDVETSLWSFDVLKLPEVAAFASDRASQADLVLVSAGPEDTLPAHVASCLQDGMSRRAGRETAVVALLEHPSRRGVEPPLCRDLKKLCRLDDGDSFFWTHDVALDSCELTPDRVHYRAEAPSAVLNGIMMRPLRDSESDLRF